MTKDTLRLIAFDMDGTVLQRDGEITERLQNILRKAMGQGIYVVPCSGRGRMQVPPSVVQVPSSGVQMPPRPEPKPSPVDYVEKKKKLPLHLWKKQIHLHPKQTLQT